MKKVKDIMTKEIITVNRSTKLKDLLKAFAKFHIFPLVPVVEEDHYLVGIVSFQNLMNVFRSYNPILNIIPFLDEEEEDIFKIELTEGINDLIIVDDIMETKFASLEEDTTLEESFKVMKLNLKEELPIIDKQGKLVGMIGVFDIIREVFRQKGFI